MPELLLINPRRKHKRKKSSHRRKRHMTAKQAMYFGGTKRRRHRKAAKNPIHHKRRRHRRAHKNPIFSRRRRSGGGGVGKMLSVKGMTSMLMPAAIGAAGALGVDLVWGFIPLPAQLKTGAFAPLAKIAGAVGVGAVTGMIMKNKALGQKVAAASVLVTVYGIAKSLLQRTMPNVQLGDADYPALEYVQAGPFLPAGQDMSAYVSGADDSFGTYVSGGNLFGPTGLDV